VYSSRRAAIVDSQHAPFSSALHETRYRVRHLVHTVSNPSHDRCLQVAFNRIGMGSGLSQYPLESLST
jgi:hypothetical protein